MEQQFGAAWVWREPGTKAERKGQIQAPKQELQLWSDKPDYNVNISWSGGDDGAAVIYFYAFTAQSSNKLHVHTHTNYTKPLLRIII